MMPGEAKSSILFGWNRRLVCLWDKLWMAWGWEGVGILLISLFGLLAIRNATLHLAGNSLVWFYKQQCWIVLGTAVYVLAALVPAFGYRRVAPWLAFGSWLALWGVLYWGVRLHGQQYTMRGWYGWNTFFVQPSEFAKPAFALFLAWGLSQFSEGQTMRRRPWFLMGSLLLLLVAWCLPIALQPDFGCILVHLFIFAVVYKYAGLSLARFGLLALPAGGVLAAVFLGKYPYLETRLLAFFHTDGAAGRESWHQIQFQNTFAAGGLWGNRSLPEQWHSNYLPLGYSDSIFATVAETTGFFMALLLIVFFLALAWRGLHLARQQPDAFRGLAIAALAGGVATQAFIHISVNTGLIPPTGLTLPFVSYGGSSLVSSFLSMGMITALSRNSPQD